MGAKLALGEGVGVGPVSITLPPGNSSIVFGIGKSLMLMVLSPLRSILRSGATGSRAALCSTTLLVGVTVGSGTGGATGKNWTGRCGFGTNWINPPANALSNPTAAAPCSKATVSATPARRVLEVRSV